MTLMELTGHEAGIIVYPNSNSVAVYNWGQCGENRIPIMTQLGEPMPWPEEEDVFEGVREARFADVRELLPGSVWLTDETDARGNRIADTDLDIVYDEDGDIMQMFLGSEYYTEPRDFEGTAYTLRDGRVILALDMWI